MYDPKNDTVNDNTFIFMFTVHSLFTSEFANGYNILLKNSIERRK